MRVELDLKDLVVELWLKRESFMATTEDLRKALATNAVQDLVDELLWFDALVARPDPLSLCVDEAERCQCGAGLSVAGPPAPRARSSREDRTAWQLAELVAESHGDVLQIGFDGPCVARAIQTKGVRSHTVLVDRAAEFALAQRWRETQATHNIEILQGSYDVIVASLGAFDGILCDGHAEASSEWLDDWTYGRRLAGAAWHLNPGGVACFALHDADSISRREQRDLARSFDRVTMQSVQSPWAKQPLGLRDHALVVSAYQLPPSLKSRSEVGLTRAGAAEGEGTSE